MKIVIYSPSKLFLAAVCTFLLYGCATAWQDKGSFLRTTQTQLSVETEPSSRVHVNNKLVGSSPLTITLDYGREILVKTRSVSYWRTQPGWSLLVTLLSLGVYLPFSVIPVDTETSLEPTGKFKGNIFGIKAEMDGYDQIIEKVTCNGQEKLSLKRRLMHHSGN